MLRIKTTQEITYRANKTCANLRLNASLHRVLLPAAGGLRVQRERLGGEHCRSRQRRRLAAGGEADRPAGGARLARGQHRGDARRDARATDRRPGVAVHHGGLHRHQGERRFHNTTRDILFFDGP